MHVLTTACLIYAQDEHENWKWKEKISETQLIIWDEVL